MLCFTIVALWIFVLNGRVQWRVGLILGLGNMSGAWVGARFAVQRGTEWVRRLLIAIIIVSAAQLLGLFDLVAGLL